MKNVEAYIQELIQELHKESELLEKSIAHSVLSIKGLRSTMNSLKDTIDESYSLFSASQAANDLEHTEISTLSDLIVEKEDELNQLQLKKQSIDSKLLELQNLDIKEPMKEVSSQTRTLPDTKYVLDKIDFIDKIVLLDPHRARTELLQLKNYLNNLYS